MTKLLSAAKRQSAEAEEQRPLLERDRKILRLESRIRDLEKQNREYADAYESAKEQADFIGLLTEARDPEAWEREIKRGTSKATAIVGLSDWHVEEPVDPAKVNGKNRFDLNIAAKRIRRAFEKIVEYVPRYVPMAKVVHIWVGGDMYSGTIHPELSESNLLSSPEACLFWMEHLNDGLAFLRKELKLPLYVICNDGNHGRMSEKLRVSTRTENSLEWLTYKFLEREWLKRDTKVRFDIAVGLQKIVEINGRKVRFSHGDAIRYGGGVGGIHIPLRKAIAQWNKSTTVDLDILGHWHSFIDGGHYLVNGSLIGYGAYSLRIKADYEPPIQMFAVFDQKFGLRQAQRIFVDDPVRD